ncbi:MAG TPA: hypothetical protein VMC78_23090 [Mycobacterium sp.]|nr:hypothetical protein [Trebonia sp.]HTZ16465.1 hypothetical protein [Mycobacterium sp.]
MKIEASNAVKTATLVFAALTALTRLTGVVTPLAGAEPNLDGTYLAHYLGATNTWTIRTRCEAAGCYAHVVSDHGWSKDAQLAGDRWTMVWVGRPDAMVCPDGGNNPATETWWWDTASLTGMVSADYGAGCGNPPVPPGHTEAPFRLTRVA